MAKALRLPNQAIPCVNNLGEDAGQPTRRIWVRASPGRAHFLRLQLAGHFSIPRLQCGEGKKPSAREVKHSARRLLGQTFHLPGQWASSARRTSSTGFLPPSLRPRPARGCRRRGPPLPSSRLLRARPTNRAARTWPGRRPAAPAGPGCASGGRGGGRGAAGARRPCAGAGAEAGRPARSSEGALGTRPR